MKLKEIINPISDRHSIKEANIGIFLGRKIHSCSSFKVIQKELEELYDRFELTNLESVDVDLLKRTIIRGEPELEVGFKLSKLDKENKLRRVFQGINEPRRSFFSYHTFDYSGWDNFLKHFLRTINKTNEIQGEIIGTAYSLHYINEFAWKNGDVNLSVLFNEESKLLPSNFFKSLTTNYLWVSGKEVEGYEYFDRLEITNRIENDVAITKISHNTTRKLPEEVNISKLLDAKEFKLLLNHAHDYNKNMLRDLLTSEAKELINLNK